MGCSHCSTKYLEFQPTDSFSHDFPISDTQYYEWKTRQGLPLIVLGLPGKVRMAYNIFLQASSHTLPCTLFKKLLHELNENMVKNKFVF